MRRRPTPGLVLAASLFLVAAAQSGASGAVPTGVSAASTGTDAARAAHGQRLRLERSAKAVQPGISAERITARVGPGHRGRVHFTLAGADIVQHRSVQVSEGVAVFKVPPLATGTYVVTGTFANLTGTTRFVVHSSGISLDRADLAVSRSDPLIKTHGSLAGSVRYDGQQAPGGYVDFYRNGHRADGRSSPDYLGFGSIDGNGTFTYAAFGADVAGRYRPGTYVFRGYYTPTPTYSDYVSSRLITVTVNR